MKSQNSGVLSQFTPRRIRRAALAMLIGLVGTAGVGCYGSFPLTNAVYRFNGSITNSGFVHSIIMIIFAIFPVYGIAMFIDAIILNLIEFWSGDPIHVSQRFEEPDGTVVVIAPGASSSEAILTIERPDGEFTALTMLRGQDGITVIRDAEGNVIGEVRPREDGGFNLVDAQGGVHSVEPTQIAALAGK